MTDIRQRTREITTLLQDLARAGQLSTTELQQFTAVLNQLGSFRFGSIRNYQQLVQFVDRLSISLRNAGQQANVIANLRQELLRLGLTYKQFQDMYTRGAGGQFQRAPFEQQITAFGERGEQYAAAGGTSGDQALYDQKRRFYEDMRRLESKGAVAVGGKKGVEVGAEAPADYKDVIQKLGLTGRAATNLETKLSKLGLTSITSSSSVKELSTGINRVRLATEDSSGNVQQFTAHIDKAGNILDDTQKRFRTFGSAIIRDTVEVLKWTIAIGLIYGPIRKLNQLIEEATKLQSNLVDVQITLGKSQTDLRAVFSAAATVADDTSSSIVGVIEGYNEALAATGDLHNEAERAATTQALLKDSMILSKLAGIEQTVALDTLVGALRQQGMQLHEGISLLNAWVAVSKNSNVSLNQLASTYAIVGTAASDAGIKMDELNGIVGTLAESTKLSADEVGNAIRGFISGFQSAKSEQTLARYGIAVRNVSGEIRSFTDLMTELAVMSQRGVLSARDVAEITNVIGGGFRRGAQLATLMNDWSRALELTAVSENAAGDATIALELKMDTLESASIRLNNSFTALAQTLGGEGGALSVITFLTDATAGLVDGLTSLIDVIGVAAPALAMLGIGKAVLGTGTGARFLSGEVPAALSYMTAPTARQLGAMPGYAGSMLPLGRGLLGGIGAVGEKTPEGMVLRRASWGEFFSKMYGSVNQGVSTALARVPGVGKQLAGLGVGGLVVPGIVAGAAAIEGDWGKAGASIGGAFLLAVATSGSSIWTAVGSLIGSALYDELIDIDTDIAGHWASVFVEMERKAEMPEAEVSAASARQKFEESLNVLERLDVGSKTFFANLIVNTQETWQKFLPGLFGVSFPGEQRDITNQDIETMLYQKQRGMEGVPDDPLWEWLLAPHVGLRGETPIFDEKTMEALDEIFNQFAQDRIEQGLEATVIQEAVIIEREAIDALAAETAQGLVEDALNQLAKGEGGVAQFLEAGQYGALATSTAKYLTAIREGQRYGLEVEEPTQQGALDLLKDLGTEERTAVTQLSDSILTDIDALENLQRTGIISDEDIQKAEEYERSIANSVQYLQGLIPALAQASILGAARTKVEAFDIVELPEEATSQQVAAAERLGREYWTDVLSAMGLTEDEIQAYIAQEKEKVLRMGVELLAQTSHIPQEYLNQALQTIMPEPIDYRIQDYRDETSGLSKGQLPGAMAQYNQLLQQFTAIPGFEPQMDKMILVLRDGFEVIDVDMRIWSLMMKDLLDLTEEGNRQDLQGVYNLPAGAGFYVPFSGYELGFDGAGGGAGGAGEAGTGFWNDLSQEAVNKWLEGVGIFKESAQALREAFISTKGTGGTMAEIGGAIGDMRDVEYGATMAELGDIIANIRGTGGTMAEVGGVITYPPRPDWDLPRQMPLPGGTVFPQGLPQLDFGGMFDALKGMLEGVSTSLNLNVQSTTHLIVDGRTLATVIKPYLYQDMLRYESSAGSTTTELVI